MSIVILLRFLLTGHRNLIGIHHDYKIARVDMICKDRLVLSAKRGRDHRRQTSKRLTLASTTNQARETSDFFGEYVFRSIGIPHFIRVSSDVSAFPETPAASISGTSPA